jgi:hypothetical protein
MLTLFEDQFFPDPEARDLIEGYVAIAEEGMDEVVGYAKAIFLARMWMPNPPWETHRGIHEIYRECRFCLPKPGRSTG